jgi:cytohesin
VTPLFVAAGSGHETVVRVLIELGADINKAEDGGVWPLKIATHFGHEAVVRALIEAGADGSGRERNEADDNGSTPFFQLA